MKVIMTGGTGMVGSLILEHCLSSEEVTEIISLVRKTTTSEKNQKIIEVVIKDFESYDNQSHSFQNVDMAFFCLGAYTGKVSDELFKKITVDYAVTFAKLLKQHSPGATLCLLSGAGADRSEKSRTAFARYKGMAENQISQLGMNFYTFRPGYIYPVTLRKEPNPMYRILRTLYPFIKLFGKNASIKSNELAEAMFKTGMNGAEKEILENKDIIEQLEKYRYRTSNS